MIAVIDAFEMFLLSKRSKGVSRSTRMLYEYAMRFWEVRWPGLALADVNANQVRTFLVWLQGNEAGGPVAAPTTDEGRAFSSSTIHNIYRNLRTFFHWCEVEELITKSPMGKVEAPMLTETIPDCLTEEEAANLLEAVRRNGDRNSFRDYVIHLFFLTTGVRLFELVALNVDSVNLPAGWAKVLGKGRKERIVGLGKDLPLEIKRYLLKHRTSQPNEAALFTNEQGHRLDRRGVQSIVSRDLKQYLGRDLNRTGPHTYRHTSITFRLRQTRDLKATSLAAGHSDTRTTERYTHLAFNDVYVGPDGEPYSPMDSVLSKRARRRIGSGKPKTG